MNFLEHLDLDASIGLLLFLNSRWTHVLGVWHQMVEFYFVTLRNIVKANSKE